MSAAFRRFREGDAAAVVALWDACGLVRPWNPPMQDIADLCAHPTADILVTEGAGGIVASVAVGYDGHRGWVYYLATDPANRGAGLGRAAMAAAEAWLQERGVAKVQLMVRESNVGVIGFYAGLGYTDSGVRVMQKWLSRTRARLQAESGHGS
jgi:ribosomal protein S18 acetylase RimI-like enzyme